MLAVSTLDGTISNVSHDPRPSPQAGASQISPPLIATIVKWHNGRLPSGRLEFDSRWSQILLLLLAVSTPEGVRPLLS